MAKAIDLTGQIFGLLTVESRATAPGVHPVRWRCRCACVSGTVLDIDSVCLRRGSATSCGCVRTPHAVDITGQQFGRWIVVKRVSPVGAKPVYWTCQCACGVTKDVDGNSLRRGMSTSCGCFQREDMSRRRTTHGQARRRQRTDQDVGWDLRVKDPTYSSWKSMHDRCYNPNTINYVNYGGRGITVCDRWRGPDGFTNFRADMGVRPDGKTIGRLNDAPVYSKDTCAWETDQEQMRSRRDGISKDLQARIAVRLAAGDSQMTIAERFGVGRRVVRRVQAEMQGIAPSRSGVAAHPQYGRWAAILHRCRHGPRYAGRGITACPRWYGEGGFQRFLDDVHSGAGAQPSPRHSIDRKNNDGNYCAAMCGGVCGHAESNIRWALWSDQMLNREGVRKFTEEETAAIAARHAAGVSMSQLGRDYRVGWQVIKRVLHYAVGDGARASTPPTSTVRGIDLRAVTLAEVRHLFERYHAYAGVTAIATYCFAVFEDGVPVAAFTWSPATPGAASAVCPEEPGAVLALTRMVAIPRAERRMQHISKALRQQARFMIDRTRWPVLITYSDEGLGHCGHVYKCAGWQRTDRNLRPQYVNAAGARVSTYAGGECSTAGLTKVGVAYIQRWEHWVCTRGEAARWMAAHGWVREAVPGKTWRSGNPASRWVRVGA